ncbi:MAG: YgcG family protein [Candidatus Krumholzibacteria bacterium]|nr:YgcG family protein [Candidatus Krumholzibacteria bacterium]
MRQGSARHAWPRVLLAAWVLLAASFAVADVAVPPLKRRVTDLTDTLSVQQQAMIEQNLATFEQRKGSQIAVLIVPTTQPETIEQYAVRVEESWKLGRKGVDDGVLLVVAKEDHHLRIEVGYGLEGVLPDAIAKRIIAEDITPHFKQGDFYGGISAGLARIVGVIDGEVLPSPTARQQPVGGMDLKSLLIFGFILVFVVGGVLRAMFGRFVGAGIVGAIAGGIAWMIGGAVLIGIVVAIIAFILSLFGGTSPGTIGGWGGYSAGGGFGDGGGFSGGGGSSGGGGASGSW